MLISDESFEKAILALGSASVTKRRIDYFRKRPASAQYLLAEAYEELLAFKKNISDSDLYVVDHEGVERYRNTTMRVTRDRLGNVLETGDLVYYFVGSDCFMARINDFNGWGDRVWLNDSSFDLSPDQLVKIIPERD